MSRLYDGDVLIKKAYDEAKGMAEPYDDFGVLVEWLVDKTPPIEPELKWILASERLPEEDGEYLVFYHTRSEYKPYVYDILSFANDLYQIDEYDFIDKKGQSGWFHCVRGYGFCEDNNVYAWMPLSEPYRGGGD